MPDAGTHGRSRGRVLLVIVVALLFGTALSTLGFYVWYRPVYRQNIAQLEQQILQVRSNQAALQAQRNVLESQLAVERSTRQSLEAILQGTQRELGAARDQIAFFNELLPPGPEGSISIRGFDVHPQGDLLGFRVLLMRHGAGAAPFQGVLQFQATGTMPDTEGTVTVNLEPARAMVAGNPTGVSPENPGQTPAQPGSVLALQFDQFQRSAGLLQLPTGFEPEEIMVNVLEGDTLRVSRTLEFPVRPPVR